MGLAELIEASTDALAPWLILGKADWNDLVERVRDEEVKVTRPCFYDEEAWTFVFCCGYAAAGAAGVALLADLLTQGDRRPPEAPRIWLEVCPIPPRSREGNSRIDLAVGDISIRADAPGSGIRLSPGDDSWACFCECKWYRDLSIDVTRDVERNQLTRVVENVLCLQHTDAILPQYVRHPFFTLVTPRRFVLDQQPPRPLCRLFQHTYREYQTSGREAILRDLSGCGLQRRSEDRWKYPSGEELNEQIDNLRMNWVTYDDLAARLPDSSLRQSVRDFWREHGKYQGRD